MKPLRFRSLPERKCIATYLLLTSVSAFLLACTGTTAFADNSTVEEIRSKISEHCEKELPEGLRVFRDRERARMDEDFDPAQQCQANNGEETESHNARSVSPETWQRRPDWVFAERREEVARRIGACRKNYQAMKDAHDAYVLLFGQYCTRLRTAMSAAAGCGEPSKRCEPQYREVERIFTHYSSKAREFGTSMKRYLTITAKASEEAAKKYETDLKLLDGEFRRRASTTSAELPNLERIDSHPNLRPGNGNGRTKTLREYYEALSGIIDPGPTVRTNVLGQPHGRLITEHKEAEKRVVKFRNSLDSLVAESASGTDTLSERWKTMIAGIDKAGPADKQNPISKINTYTPAITGGTQIAGQMFGNQNPASALSAATGGPSLAAIGAAAAAGAALSNGFGGGASQQAPAEQVTPQEAAKTFTPSPVAKLDEVETNPGGTGTGFGTNELPKNNPKGEAGNVDTAGPAAFPAFGAGEGTSRMLAGSKKTGRPPASEAKAPDAGMGEEGLSNFGARGMDPKPSPKGAALSPGAEVANLLGQMKDLFNFDEGAGPAGGMPSGPGTGLGGEPQLDQGMAGTGSSEEPGVEGEPNSQDSVAEATDGAAASPGEVQGAQFGRVDTSLFKRVRQRHTRCMERGLVLYQLGERVE